MADYADESVPSHVDSDAEQNDRYFSVASNIITRIFSLTSKYCATSIVNCEHMLLSSATGDSRYCFDHCLWSGCHKI